MRLGTTDFQMHVIVAEVEDEGILGMDFLSQVDSHIDIVKNQVSINGEVFDCSDFKNQPLSSRCMVRRSTIIEPNTEVIVPVTVHKRSSNLNPNVSQLGIRLLEPCLTSHLQQKGLYVARTLVDVKEDRVVPLRVCNVSDEVFNLAAETVVALAKPVIEVTSLELYEESQESVVGQARAINQQVSHETMERTLPESLQDLLKRSAEHLTDSETERLQELLHNYQQVFSLSDGDLGTTHMVQHRIETGKVPPIRQQPRRTSPWKHDEIERQVTDLLQQGKVKESSSPWSSPVVLVTKRDGSQRLCVDYRQLNAATVKDAFPLPRVDDSLAALSGSRWFSTLDLASGYWQVAMGGNTQEKAAFVTPSGLYEWNVMPFGLCNAPSTFARLMELVLKGFHWKICLIYLDDVIVMGHTFEEELERLEQVFERLAWTGLKLKPEKCFLFQKRVSYLGHVVTKEGISADPGKVEQVRTWPIPENRTEVKSFLGLASYYRRFVPDFSTVAQPLYKLTEAKKEFVWTGECQVAFDSLKGSLTSARVLAYPTREGKFVLDTDASDHGIGAVLSQFQGGMERPIAFASRTLSKSERNYCVTRRELLAIVEFVKQHRHYLQGTRFCIRTDHAPLRSVIKAKDPEGQLARWIEFLSTFDFEIQYRPGQRHQNADALSRRPCDDRCKWCKGWKFQNQVSFVHVGVQTAMHLPNQDIEQPANCQAPVCDRCGTVKLKPSWTSNFLREQQEADADLKVVIGWKKASERKPLWEDVSPQSRAVKTLWSQWDRLLFRNGVLCRKWENDIGDQITNQVVLPDTLRQTAFEAHHSHTTASHRGVRKTISALQSRYYWPGLTSAVHRLVASCHICGSKKTWGKKRRSPLKQYVVGAPMERIAIDILGPLPETPRKNKFILVVSDYFTKWTESYPIPNQEAATVAEKLVSEFICRFGVPRELHSDQGTNFESKVFGEICKLLDIQKTRTTPLHPQSDGQVERFNRTLVEMLRGKIKEDQKDWDLQLPACMMAYRGAVHESTGVTPNLLMLGRELEVPLDAITEAPPDAPPLKTDYAQAVQKRLASAHDLARRHLNKAAIRQKRNYDKRLAGRPFTVGDSVWLHNVRRKKGRNAKLDCPWEGPYLVISVLSDVVYRIQKSRKAKPKVVHSDRLKPYLGPPLERWIPKRQTQLSKPREEERKASDVDSPVFVEDGQSAPINEREGVEFVEAEATLGEEDDVTPRPQNADCIGADNSDQPDDAREPEPGVELSTSSAECQNPEDVSSETVELTVQVIPQTDSSNRGRPSRQRKPPSRYGTWVAGYPDCPVILTRNV